MDGAGVETLAARLGVGRASPRDLVGLGRALEACGRIAETIQAPPALLGPKRGAKK